MKVKELIDKMPKTKTVDSISNDKYKEICDTRLNQEIKEIKKLYTNSLNEAWKYYVR